MTPIQEIRLTDTLRRYNNPQTEHTPPEVFQLACSLSDHQRELLASIITVSEDESGAELSTLRHCLIRPHSLLAGPQQALFVVERHLDGKLYNAHTQGPEAPIEPVDEGVATLFPHVAKHAIHK